MKDIALSERNLEENLVVDILIGADQYWNIANESKEEKFAKRDMNGISRSKGRFCNSTLPDTAKFPAWLPCDHHITKLIIRDCQGDAQWSKRNTNRIEISFLAHQGTARHQKTDLQLRNV